MRVGLAIYGDISNRSGGYLYDRMLVKHLLEHGDEVEIVTVPGQCRTSSIISNYSPLLLRRFTELDLDVLVEDELCHHSLCLINNRLKKAASCPLIGLFHFLACRAEPNRGKAHRHEVVERRFASTLDGCIFNSAGTAEAVRHLLPGCQGIIARPGRDHIHPMQTIRKRSSRLKVLFIGNIAPEKGLDVLIEAMAALPNERFFLEVAGPALDPEYLMYVHSLIERRSMQCSVRFWGWVAEGERENLMSKADVLVVPSFFEGYGLVFVEAMACGLPVIAPLCGGANEIVREGREGFLVRAGDAAAISGHLRNLEEDTNLWEEMGDNARKRYHELPTWDEEMSKARSYLRSFL
ncbi:MAG: glycosyltransferase family 4 protein [Candidatus Saccharibacteria bacterium]